MAETAKPPVALNLEVEVVESRTKPGCSSSSTHPLCTCPVAAAPRPTAD
ncbi:MAG TPA: hypothetical protein VFC25_07055 [Verrucomicrobiae bacterium]|jgi:hypothetical protein|nr:hypothetical protein [Verrucomicrobiae bacterium]